MDVSKLKDSYPNAPVYSVSWEIIYETDIKDEKLNESIKKLSNLLLSDFPEQKPFNEFVLNQEINLKEFKSISKPERKIVGSGVEIKNKDEVILIGTHKLVIITKNHSNFSKFSVLMKDILHKFENSFPVNVLNIKRLGLRYINHCPLPDNNTQRFKEFFIINLNLFDQSSIANINISFHEILSNNLNLRTQYHSILIEKIPIIAIDLDCFEIAENEPFIKFNELNAKSIHMAKLIKEKFALSITEDFVKIIMEKEL